MLISTKAMKRIVNFLAGGIALGISQACALAQTSPPQAAAANPADLSQYQTADALWLHIQDLQRGPNTRPTTQEQYQSELMQNSMELAASAVAFIEKYPDDPRRWDATLLEIISSTGVERLRGHPDPVGYISQLRALATVQQAPAEVRAQARYILFELSLDEYLREDPSVTAQSIVGDLRQFTLDFPTFPHLDALTYQVSRSLYRSPGGESEALLAELANSGQGPIADRARAELAGRARLKSPLDLHFTATDGSDVDFTKLRGKVVLVYFWATSNPESCERLPEVVGVYQKLHAQGFEVVGISFDQSKNALMNFTFSNNMVWPEYCDGKVWENAIASAFGVHWIPTAWLVNKQGYVVSTQGLGDLEAQVEKLLAAK